ncbi:MAG: ABC transporter ATP-binding protein [Alphaproteobacteria bacterium]|nr:ABC transporter ATP-binding protein [Alphaproteobacteria bacterium]
MLQTDPPNEAAAIDVPAAAPLPALDVRQLSVQYGARRVLNGLNLSIDSGEIFGLLGPNGAGKTTLIRAICGRVKHASGHVHIAGQSNRKRQSLRRIGLVPQEIALYQHLTVRENLTTFGRLSGLSARQAANALTFAMKATRLNKRADEYVHTLSGGWKRRCNIAAAILHRPSLLILDEPTVGVDIDARNALHTVIRDLSRTGLAVLLATHDLDQAQTLCGRVGFLRDGSVTHVGGPAELLHDMFGTKRELHVDLFEPAEWATASKMKRVGFSDHPNGMEWSMLIDASAQRQTELTNALRQTDLRIKEIRFREPGLDSLFLRLTTEDRST